MDVAAHDSARWSPAPEEHFTGAVSMAPLGEVVDPGLRAMVVRFESGGHTHWHSHPEGQVLHVLSGHGLVATADGTRHEIGPGDVVTARPGEIHWHGATPDSDMTHISVTASDTVWATEVTGAEYAG